VYSADLKSDNCASYALDPSVRFGAMRDALNRTGHPIVLSIEPFSIIPDPSQSVKVANLWRTGCDISGDWNDIINRADIADKWAPLARPGGWNDPDSEVTHTCIHTSPWSVCPCCCVAATR
jgi:alpha-galactosidase